MVRAVVDVMVGLACANRSADGRGKPHRMPKEIPSPTRIHALTTAQARRKLTAAPLVMTLGFVSRRKMLKLNA